MRILLTFLLAVCFCLLGDIGPLAGDDDRKGKTPYKIRKPQTEDIEVSRRSVNINLRNVGAPKSTWRVGDLVKEVNPREDYGRNEAVKKIETTLRSSRAVRRPDPLLGLQIRATMRASGEELSEPIINIDGLDFSGVNPPDMVGDVGKDFYIQSVNSAGGAVYQIYNKLDGSVAAGPFDMESLGGPKGKGDPIILYDHLAERWFFCEFANAGNKLIFYISKTSDPISGGFHEYTFSTPHFPDYPKVGIWPDAYYITSNESDGPAVYAFQRKKMIAGEESPGMRRFLLEQLDGFGFQAATPADLDGPAPPDGSPGLIIRHHDDEVHNSPSDDENDFLDLYEVQVDWSDPSNMELRGPIEIPTMEFDSELNGLTSFECFPQPDTTTKLDPLREVIMWRVQYRNFGDHESLVGSFVTDVNGRDQGGVRWFELRKTSLSDWRVHQEGTYAPDEHNRWMSSIAMDGKGNIALAYNVSSDTIHPSLRYTGRTANDPMGTMPQTERTLVSGTGSNFAIRYGDYSSLNLDPSNDKTFWFTGEHNASENWSTRIGTFEFGDSPASDSDAPDLGGPNTSDSDVSGGPATDSEIGERLNSVEKSVKEILTRLNDLIDQENE